jgi:c-di-GMP-binding flagellar brake protein YcgR
MCRFGGAPEYTEVTTLNISQSGMLVRCGFAVPVGTEIAFKFLLETGFEILSGTGKVSRVADATPDTGAMVGIAFDELEAPKRRILARVIQLHTESAGEDPGPGSTPALEG